MDPSECHNVKYHHCCLRRTPRLLLLTLNICLVLRNDKFNSDYLRKLYLFIIYFLTLIITILFTNYFYKLLKKIYMYIYI